MEDVLLELKLLNSLFKQLGAFDVPFEDGDLDGVDALFVLLLLAVLCLKEGNGLYVPVGPGVVQQGVLARVVLVYPAPFFDDSIEKLVVVVSQGYHGRGSFVSIR